MWVKAVQAAAHPHVNHLLFFVGERAPRELRENVSFIWIVEVPERDGLSIGHWHNVGAKMATSEWIMKLDIDTLPNPRYFKELLPVLERAGPSEWFNGGMLYLNRKCSQLLETKELTERSYEEFVANPGFYSSSSYLRPAGTNFICRRQSYLDLGGCDERFRGYGWEDYQQIFMLESCERGFLSPPLPGGINISNVTQRCRDEISRPKALELFQVSRWLCLLHRWHSKSVAGVYRSYMNANRQILLEHVLGVRK